VRYKRIMFIFLAVVFISGCSSKPSIQLAKDLLLNRLKSDGVPATISKYEVINGRDILTKDGTKGYIMYVEADILFDENGTYLVGPGFIIRPSISKFDGITGIHKMVEENMMLEKMGNVVKEGYIIEMDKDSKAGYYIIKKGGAVRMKFEITFMKTDKGWKEI